MVLQAVFEKRLKDMAMAVPLMCCAADMLRVPSRKQVVVVGERTFEEFETMLTAAHPVYDPNRTVSAVTLYKVYISNFSFWLSSITFVLVLVVGYSYRSQQ